MFNFPQIVVRTENSAPKARPPPPTPINLPAYEVSPTPDIPDKQQLNVLFVQTPALKWSSEHHKRLGIELANKTWIQDLVPTTYIPPKTWEDRPAPEQSEQRMNDTSAPSSETLSNGAAIPGHEAFYSRITELKCDREDALNALARRKTSDGKRQIRVSHYRKFWHSFDNISCYWDTSMDDYRPEGAPAPMSTTGYEMPKSDLAIGAGPPLSQTNPDGHIAAPPEIKDYYGLRTSDGRSMTNNHRADFVGSLIEPIVQAMGCHYEARMGPPGGTRAVRIQNGLIRQEVTGMVFRGPEDRTLARQGWNEGPLIAVSARKELDFTQPANISKASKNEEWASRFRSSNVDLLAQLQNPATRAAATGHLEELGFHVTDGKNPKILRWKALDVIDFSQEAGILLMLAQMRARNAKSEEEVKPGTDKWWAEARRFGGHYGQGEAMGQALFRDDQSPIVNEEKVADEIAEMAVNEQNIVSDQRRSRLDMHERPKPQSTEPIDPEAAMIAVSPSRMIDKTKKRRRRFSDRAKREAREVAQMRARQALSWKMPKPLWDARTQYIPVGMGPEQEFDHIYLVSSVYHHVSILRLRIHPAMLAWIAGEKDSKDVPRPPTHQYGLYISRTKWFDLLNKDDRVEAMRGIWGVMAYMMRDTSKALPEDRAFARRLSTAGVLAGSPR